MSGKVVCRRLCVVIVAACAVMAAATAPAGAQGWTVQPTPALGPPPNPPYDSGAEGFMDGVSCTAPDLCAAVGGSYDASPPTGAGEFWDGSTWSLLSEDFSDVSPLLGVSCAGAQPCLAVGYTVHTAAPQVPVAGLVSSTAIHEFFPPAIGDEGQVDSLNAVSCTSATRCTAVGNTSVPTHSPLLIESWDGTAWQLPSPATPPGALFDFAFGTTFNGISCVAASSCVAVGTTVVQPAPGANDVQTTLAEDGNGSTWSLATTPNPSGATESVLTAVSCPARGECVAVGFWQPATAQFSQYPLAERLSHGRWRLMTLPPAPAQSNSSSLTGVSCPTAQTCTAVGSRDDSAGNPHSIALRLHGDRWQAQTTPTVPGTAADALSAVSCPTRRACTAVGYVLDDSIPAAGNRQEPLAERWVGSGHGGDHLGLGRLHARDHRERR